MEAEKIGQDLFNQVKNEGLSTDYCYSPDFYKWCKEKAVNKAESKYSGNLLKNIVDYIKNLPA